MRIRLAALTLAVAAATALTGCTGDSPAPSAVATTEEPTPAVAEEQVTALDPANFATRTVAALVSAQTMQMGMEMTGEGQTVSITGPVRMTKTSMDMHVTYDMMGMAFDMILVEGRIFMGMDGQYQEMTAADMGVASVEDLMAQTDARAQIEGMQAAIVDVQPQGEEDIEGVPTTHYQVTVDPSRLTSVEPEVAAEMGDSFVYDYWVDAEDRPVRMGYSVQGVDAVVTYTGFGEPVDIAAPDPSLLVDGLF